MFDRDGQDLVDALAAIFQVVAVDDAAAGIQRERRFGDIGFGGIDDQRRLHRQRQLLDQLLHLRLFVIALGQGDADIKHVSAALHLPDGDLDDAVVIVFQQQALDYCGCPGC